MNTSSNNEDEIKLLELFHSVNPIVKDIGKIVKDSRKLDSRLNKELNQLDLHVKVYTSKMVNDGMTEHEIEDKAHSMCNLFGELEKIMTEISNDKDESILFLDSGLLDKFNDVSQRLAKFLS